MGNTIDEDIEKINRYIAYLQKYGNQYYNAFEVLNTSENSFSEFIAWLFDIEKVTEKKEESIQYYFIKEFLKKLWKDEQDTKIKEEYKQLDFNNFFDKFIENCIVNTQKDNMDIVITSENLKFMIVIENKIAAKISAKNNCTQIENYTKINDEYAKKYVFICANKDFYPEQPLKKHIAQKNYAGECKEGKIKELLDLFGYSILEHYDIAVILYNFLYNKYAKLFKNGILLPTEFMKMYNTVQEIYNKIPEKKKTKEQVKLLKDYLDLNNDNKQIILYKDLKKNKISIRSVTLPIRKVLENSNDEEKISIVCQYIEFCELHNGEVDNFQAYTKIIDGEPIWNICENIYKSEEKWQELKNNSNYKELNNLLNNIEESEKRKNQK